MNALPRALCRLDEIPDGGAKGFDLGADYDPREVFLVREGDQVYGYVNSCPHLGTPLEMMDDEFVNDDGYILCSTHGALFEADNGACIAGPCYGEYLSRLVLQIDKAGGITLIGLPFSSRF
ncbi:MAG: Rieske 2Fe-2S domain-containing protein [Rhodospirillales bacterium]